MRSKVACFCAAYPKKSKVKAKLLRITLIQERSWVIIQPRESHAMEHGRHGRMLLQVPFLNKLGVFYIKSLVFFIKPFVVKMNYFAFVVICCVSLSREIKQNSRGRRRPRRQNDKTNYTRQKEHVNMWNKADIRAVLLWCETSTAPFSRRLQNVVNISN